MDIASNSSGLPSNSGHIRFMTRAYQRVPQVTLGYRHVDEHCTGLVPLALPAGSAGLAAVRLGLIDIATDRAITLSRYRHWDPAVALRPRLNPAPAGNTPVGGRGSPLASAGKTRRQRQQPCRIRGAAVLSQEGCRGIHLPARQGDAPPAFAH